MEIVIIDKITREVITAFDVSGMSLKDIVIAKGYDIKIFQNTQATYRTDDKERLILTSDSFIIKGANK